MFKLLTNLQESHNFFYLLHHRRHLPIQGRGCGWQPKKGGWTRKEKARIIRMNKPFDDLLNLTSASLMVQKLRTEFLCQAGLQS